MKSASQLVAIFCLLASAPLFAQQNRIAGSIDNSRFVALDSSVRPLAIAEHGDEGAVDPSLHLPWMTLWFRRTPAQEDALARLLAAQQDSTSPKYRQWLTSDEYARQFGLSQADIDSIAAWLTSQGFHLEYTANDRDFIAFSGTAAQVRAAFHTEIHRYTIRGESHYVNSTPPSVPVALSPVVLSLQGLTDFRPRPRLLPGKPAAQLHPHENDGDGVESLAPDDIAAIYNIAPLYDHGIDGSGQSIVVLGGSNVNLDDIRAFRTHYNLPGADPRIIECCGADPGETLDSFEQEADLDLEWTSAVARKAGIIFVYAQDPINTITWAIDQHLAPVISESFGACETYISSLGVSAQTLRSLAQTANAKGVTWLSASGDAGAADCDGDSAQAFYGIAVDFPASIPEVTGVGGTELNEGPGTWWRPDNGSSFGSALGYISETAWNETAFFNELSASGGGASVIFGKPAWQTGFGVPADGRRDVPDVSLTASTAHDAYNVFTIDPSTDQHLQTTVGGTSVPAQVFAGIVALLNQSETKSGKPTVGNINPSLYALAAEPGIFHDVSTGDNIVPCASGTPNCTTGSYGFSASPGYDKVTGLGSPDVYALVSCWDDASDRPSTTLERRRKACQPAVRTAVAVTASPNLIFTNGWTDITANVSRARGAGSATGAVTFTSGSTVLGTAAIAGGVASLNLDGSLLSAGNNTITAAYSGDTRFDRSSASTTVTVSTPADAVTFTASPNPIVSSTGVGMTTLTWNAPGYTQLAIDVGSSTGSPLGGPLASTGSVQTGASVTDGLQFFLVDLTTHAPIASVTVHVAAPTLKPVLTSITPPAAETGSDGFTLAATGSNFASSSVVTWGGQKLATRLENSSSLFATVPTALLAGAGAIQVQVITNGQASAALPFNLSDQPWLVNSMMTESASTAGCQVPTPTTTFLTTDSGATVWFYVSGAVAGDFAEAQWSEGGGAVSRDVYWGPLYAGGSWCFADTLPTNSRAGDWKVVVSWNFETFFSLPFTISTPSN